MLSNRAALATRRRFALLGMLVALGALLALPSGALAVTGAGFTTVNESVDGTGHCQNGNPNTNCNIYDGKEFVWLNGGPSTAYVGDGTYFFAVLAPGGQADPNDGTLKNLSSNNDAYTNRTFTVTNGTVSYTGDGISPPHEFDSNKIRLLPYDDTPNPGGVYIMAICSLANGYPVNPSNCKYDAFKVNSGNPPPPNTATDLTVTKDANGAFDDTRVEQIGGTATFTYTVSVTHDSGTKSDVTVSGTISVFNLNIDGDGNTVPVSGVDVTDQLSDNTVCSVTNGSDQTLTQGQTDFAYTCSLASLPQGELDNTVTATWPGQTLLNGDDLAANSATFTFSSISFTGNPIDDCVSVTDVFNGGLPSSIGSACQTDPSPITFPSYTHTVNVPASNCVSYSNTATFTTDTTQTTGSDGKTVTVCGPAKTGALTMGFWQNKNGQGIITTGASTAGVCNSGTWLRQYAPFQDLSSTATCSQVAGYVLNVIKAASCTSTSKTCNSMLKAQMLATALDVYFSDPALGGNKIGAPGPIGGVKIDLTKVCKMIDASGGTATCSGSYEDASSAFGGAGELTISQMLAYAASQSNVGGTTWYGQVKATQVLAKDAFDAINNGVAFPGP
jgi:hypothetical protein